MRQVLSDLERRYLTSPETLSITQRKNLRFRVKLLVADIGCIERDLQLLKKFRDAAINGRRRKIADEIARLNSELTKLDAEVLG
jgi:uncharacterized protein YydD (DUF2326 family)